MFPIQDFIDDDILEREQNIGIGGFPDSFQLMSLNLTNMTPKTPRQWFTLLWGYDIFIQGKIPFLKSLVLANIIVWLVF